MNSKSNLIRLISTALLIISVILFVFRETRFLGKSLLTIAYPFLIITFINSFKTNIEGRFLKVFLLIAIVNCLLFIVSHFLSFHLKATSFYFYSVFLIVSIIQGILIFLLLLKKINENNFSWNFLLGISIPMIYIFLNIIQHRDLEKEIIKGYSPINQKVWEWFKINQNTLSKDLTLKEDVKSKVELLSQLEDYLLKISNEPSLEYLKRPMEIIKVNEENILLFKVKKLMPNTNFNAPLVMILLEIEHQKRILLEH